MIEPAFSTVLRKLYNELQGSEVNWVVTGSLNFALQGLSITPRDIDIQTDSRGAYEIEHRFASYVTRKVVFSSTERIRSHFGALQIDGITVELMGDIQKRLEDGRWEDLVDLNRHKLFMAFEGMDVPVLSLEYEAQAYRKLGRLERSQMLQEALMGPAQDKAKGDCITFTDHLFDADTRIRKAFSKSLNCLFHTCRTGSLIRMCMIDKIRCKDFIGKHQVSCTP